MANRYKGEKEFDWRGQTYTLRFGVNEIAEAEAAFEVRGKALWTRLEQGSMIDMRKFLQLGLARKHPKLSLVQVGDIIDEFGLAAMTSLIGDTLTAAFVGPDGAKPGDEDAESEPADPNV
jgi:hypothetical protein